MTHPFFFFESIRWEKQKWANDHDGTIETNHKGGEKSAIDQHAVVVAEISVGRVLYPITGKYFMSEQCEFRQN